VKRIALALFSVLILVAMALPGGVPGGGGVVLAGQITYEYRAWDKTSSDWSHGNIAGYAEGGCIPSYLKVTNSGTSTENITITLSFDCYDNQTGQYGILGYALWLAILPALTIQVPSGDIKHTLTTGPSPSNPEKTSPSAGVLG
jgi:hypothetical protein